MGALPPLASPPLGAGASPSPGAPQRAAGGSSQLGDQFRESVQAGGAVEDLPQEGWFVGVNGVPLGPIPLGDLRELAVAGHIDRRSLVWRDGQSEWRPLGKFPGLARVIDDGAAPARAEPTNTAPAAAPPVAFSNGANGHTGLSHVATGFDVPRADAGERPSAWGDLDDEDDEDEQPTTVKGRVSVMPSGGAPPSVTSLPSPVAPGLPNAPAPAAPPLAAPNPFGITSSVVPTPPPVSGSFQAPIGSMPPVASMPPGMSEPAAPVSIISAMPEPDDEDGLRPPGRSKWYLIAVAIVFAFALGAIVTHLMRSSSSDKASSESSNASEPGAAAKKRYDDVELDAEGSGAKATAASEPHPEAITAALRPGDLEPGEGVTTARAALAPASSADAVEARAKLKASATGSLLSGLGSPHAPPPPTAAREERAMGSGLDATAIQRTVRRYSPAVRQNCWLRALDARAAGVPASAKLTATITVEAGGRVQGVSVSGAPRGYPSLSRCVENAVKGWQFPRSGTQTVTNVPFMFVGQ